MKYSRRCGVWKKGLIVTVCQKEFATVWCSNFSCFLVLSFLSLLPFPGNDLPDHVRNALVAEVNSPSSRGKYIAKVESFLCLVVCLHYRKNILHDVCDFCETETDRSLESVGVLLFRPLPDDFLISLYFISVLSTLERNSLHSSL